MKCPKCGSTNVAPILFGKPIPGYKILQRLTRRKDIPWKRRYFSRILKHRCLFCKKDFTSKPILISDRKKEDYRDIVTSIQFRDGGYFDGYSSLIFEKKGGLYYIRYDSPFGDFLDEEDSSVTKPLPKRLWSFTLDRLFCELYLHEWDHEFFNRDVLDGEQWDLEIKLTEDRIIEYHGSNAFPPYWGEFKALLRPAYTVVRGYEDD